MKLNELLQSDHFEEKEEICPSCQNHCQVRVYSFANGRQYVSGNNCERVYSNEGTTARKGINMFEEKYKMLFEQRVPAVSEANDLTAQRSVSAAVQQRSGLTA